MALAWLVECKTCSQRFAVQARESVAGKSTATLEPGKMLGPFECPHCHEVHEYSTDEFIPGQGRLHQM